MVVFPESLVNSIPKALLVAGDSPMHSHKFWEFAIFLFGKSYNYEPNGKKTTCEPLTCMIFRPDKDCHHIRHEIHRSLAHIDIYVSKSKMEEICSLIETENGTPILELLNNSKNTPKFALSKETFSFIQKIVHAKDFSQNTAEINNLHSSIILLILSEYYLSTKQGLQQSDMIEQIVSLLKNPDNFTYRLDNLLKQVPFSRTHINNEFKKQLGITPIAFFDKQKILFSTTLLLTTNDTILTIANTVGFATPKNFIAQFKKAFDCTPSEYRKKNIIIK